MMILVKHFFQVPCQLFCVVLISMIGATTVAPPAGAATSPPRIFARFDSNKDGKLTAAEIRKRSEKHFRRLDRNNSGSIEMVELQTYLDARAKRKSNSDADDGQAGRAGKSFGKYDVDNDGAVSQAEYISVSATRFGKADADADGVVSIAEYLSRRSRKDKGADVSEED